MKYLLSIAMLLNSMPGSAAPLLHGNFPSPVRKTVLPAKASPATDPTPTPTPTPDPVLEQATRDALLAEELRKRAVADQERAEAEAAKLKALAQPLGTPSNVSVPSGNVSTDAAGWVESQMLAQEAARQITMSLTTSLCSQANLKTIVIYSNSDITSVDLYGSIISQLRSLKDDLSNHNRRAESDLAATHPQNGNGPNVSASTTDAGPVLALAAPGIATGMIKSVAELVNLFRSDTSFTNKTVAISEDVIVSYLVKELIKKRKGCPDSPKLYYPALFPPQIINSNSSALIGQLNDVEKAKGEATVNIKSLDARIKELTSYVALDRDRTAKDEEKKGKESQLGAVCKKPLSPPCKELKEKIKTLGDAIVDLDAKLKPVESKVKSFPTWIKALEALKSDLETLVTSTSLISAKLNAPDESSKLTALSQLLRAERLYSIMSNANTYTLRVLASANGTTKVKKNLFVDAKVRHSAGANLTYQLFDNDGGVVQGDSMKCYIEYQSSQDVQKIVSGSKNVICRSDDNTSDHAEPNAVQSLSKP